MTDLHLQRFLAQLYVDENAREAFVRNPEQAALAAGLPPELARELARMDLEGLALAAHSFAVKRERRARLPSSLIARLVGMLHPSQCRARRSR